jgi:hypothetical protein
VTNTSGQLAPRRFVQRQEHVARRLLRDRAAALAFAPAVATFITTALQHAHPVDAVVLEEPVVLRGQHGLPDQRRHLLEGHRDAPLLADLRHQGPRPAE